MSRLHPVVAVTGSSGAGTTYVRRAFEHIFRREGLNSAVIEGDCFHRFDRATMQAEVEKATAAGRNLTHFGPEGNLLSELQALFRQYSECGTGERRYYVHNEQQAARRGRAPGTFTDWEPLPEGTDLMFYEGLHGALVCDDIDLVRYTDLVIGVVPIINLEWIQKIHRDRNVRGYSRASATKMILSRMHDYVHYITPQFSRTDINFQRVPTVDTSNPFAAEEIPDDDESFVVVHVRNVAKLAVDFRALLDMVDGSFMSRHDTLVIPASKKILTIELIISPVIKRMISASKEAKAIMARAES